ncbi:DNA cytosine methyltransferase [Rhodococcus sp. JVH1]|uniref:DNA cytosine methyltransferase n=1 Tax=Rhodococcus sp. JVH1 TaxID=745408 RepID=UPI0002720299|nr:DNA cytosine methyltransferase [Rhodococcus sp. JVH1]EJJ00196.1 modification methylase NaeI [Rhodococcus sp. JVH1]
MERDQPGKRFTSLEICAGGGGLALGLEQAGFDPVLLLDNRPVACATLRENRPGWDVRETDLLDFDPVDDQQVYDVDLLSAGLPRLKAAAAVARTRDSNTEVDLVKATIMLMHGVQPRALLVDNVPDLVTSDSYMHLRSFIEDELTHLGYACRWLVLNAADYGVPQDRKHGFLVAFKGGLVRTFDEPPAVQASHLTVGCTLHDSMASRGWHGAREWARQADRLAPTLVGGSWERGGADLGPTGSKKAWARIGVDGGTIDDEVPPVDFQWIPSGGRSGMIRLTVDQAALLQGFPTSWHFAGRKTARYRQVANAVPPPLARALGTAIAGTLGASVKPV